MRHDGPHASSTQLDRWPAVGDVASSPSPTFENFDTGGNEMHGEPTNTITRSRAVPGKPPCSRSWLQPPHRVRGQLNRRPLGAAA